MKNIELNMVEILVRKEPEIKIWKLTTECTGNGNGGKGCGSTLQVNRDDLRFFEEQEFPWRIQPAAVCFKCPICSKITDIHRDEYPDKWIQLTPWSREWHYENNE